ncbi:hypothetical protein Tco_0453509 [Tanacetum coccineum]
MMKHESSDVVEDIEPILMITKHSDGTNKHYLDTNGMVHERLMKKPKVDVRLPEGFFDPIIRDKQVPSIGNGFWVNEKKEVVSSLSKQFWVAGDDESCGNSDMVIPPVGMDHLRVHPRFLHSNPTRHKWALGDLLLSFCLTIKFHPQVRTGATYAKVDVLNNEKDTRSKMLLIEDNGGGMTPDRMQKKYSSTKVGYSNSMVNDEVNRSDVFPDNHVKKVGRSVIQDDDTSDNFRLTAKDDVVSHNIYNVEKVVNLQKSKWEEESMSFMEMLDWVANAARNPHDRAFEASQR